MSDLKRTLADLAERGTPIGADRLRDRVMLDLAPGSASTLWSRAGTRRPVFVILGAVAATLLLVGAIPLLFGWMGTSGSETASATTVAEPEPVPPVVGVGDRQTVSVTVTGVSGRAGDELAGVLYAGGELTDLDGDAVGGFWTMVEGDDFTATEVVREPGVVGVGRFPFVSDQALTVEPGSYTLVLWVDDGLSPVSRWVPINTYTEGDVLIEGTDLFGCHVVFEVGDDAQTDVAVEAGLHHNGWNTDCTTGVAIPGTDAAAAVAPPMDNDEAMAPPIVGEMWVQDRDMAMPPAIGVGDGQTVNVTVSDVSGYANYELAGVLYAGGDLKDLDRDALGGFWSVVEGDPFTTTEVVREPDDSDMGRFPYVSDRALTVVPGTYTLVVWVDTGLGGVSRWVPVNSDGMGLYGCQAVFEVADDAQTDVAITANLVPNGWNSDCTTGVAIPGTDAAAAVAPDDEMLWPELEKSMPPVVGVGEGQTVSVTVSDVSGYGDNELAGVLYAGGELPDLDRDALGGFWVVVDGNNFTTTEVVREPGALGEGRFPYISEQALTVASGTYTLVLWVDFGLSPVSRWVPVNSDGMGLYGCQVVFEVGDEPQTNIVANANLVPNGWNTDCTTGVAIPGTDADAAVAPTGW